MACSTSSRRTSARTSSRRNDRCAARPAMDEKLKRRILMFYIGGILNALLGLYVLIEGASFLPPDTARILVLVFLAFAAGDFFFPYIRNLKWLAENAGKQAQDSDRVQRS